MSRRATTQLAVLVAVSALAVTLALPAMGWASSGGAGFGASPTTRFAAANAQPGDISTTATSGGISLSAKVSAMLSRGLHFTGVVPAADAGQTVVIERLDRVKGWLRTAHGTAASDASFSITWRTNHIGRFAIRALLLRGSLASTRSLPSSPTVDVTIYRPAIATWYGPGSWGSTTACGETLTPQTLGVAHRWLQCGTPVALYYGGRTIIVPVIDRGPYANNADYDLTQATARALGTDGISTIGAVSLPGSTPTAAATT